MKKWLGLCIAMMTMLGTVSQSAMAGTETLNYTFPANTTLSADHNLSFSFSGSGITNWSSDTFEGAELTLDFSDTQDYTSPSETITYYADYGSGFLGNSYPSDAPSYSIVENYSTSPTDYTATFTFNDNPDSTYYSDNWGATSIPMTIWNNCPTMTLTSATLTITYDQSGGSGVPEPATLLLLGSGLVGLAGLRKKFAKA